MHLYALVKKPLLTNNLSAEWGDFHAGDGDAAHLCVVELCLDVQRLQNLVENRV